MGVCGGTCRYSAASQLPNVGSAHASMGIHGRVGRLDLGRDRSSTDSAACCKLLAASCKFDVVVVVVEEEEYPGNDELESCELPSAVSDMWKSSSGVLRSPCNGLASCDNGLRRLGSCGRDVRKSSVCELSSCDSGARMSSGRGLGSGESDAVLRPMC